MGTESSTPLLRNGFAHIQAHGATPEFARFPAACVLTRQDGNLAHAPLSRRSGPLTLPEPVHARKMVKDTVSFRPGITGGTGSEKTRSREDRLKVSAGVPCTTAFSCWASWHLKANRLPRLLGTAQISISGRTIEAGPERVTDMAGPNEYW